MVATMKCTSFVLSALVLATTMALPVVKHAQEKVIQKKDQALLESNTNTSKGPCVSLAQDPDGKFRHAGDDCNEVMPKVREEIKDGIEKGEFIGHVYNDATHHMNIAKAEAETTLESIEALLKKAEETLADAEAKLEGATDADKEADEESGLSKVDEWEEIVDAQKAAIRFFKSLMDNAKKVIRKADDGLANAEKLTAKVKKADEASDHDLDFDSLTTETKDVDDNAKILMKQLEDAAGDYDCGSPPVTLNSDSMCDGGNTKFSPKCTVVCTKGYTEVGSENTLRCVRQGKFGKELYGDWFGLATCLPMNCGAPYEIDNSVQEAEEIFFPNAAEYTCEFGFSTTGKIEGAVDFSIFCQDTGHYEPKKPSDVCEPVECGEAPIVANANRPQGIFYYTDKATYNCVEGSTLDGNAAGEKTFETECQGTSFFTEAMACKPVVCGPPLVYLNGVVEGAPPEGDNRTRYFGDEVKYLCSEGYTTSPEGVVGSIADFKIRCQADGNFEPMGANKNPQCYPITCGMAPTIPHGNLIAKEMFYSDEQTVTAHDGWSLSGIPGQDTTFLIMCIADGSYSGIQVFKRTECGPCPSEAHGAAQNPPAIAVYEDEILYNCDDGYSTDETREHSASFYTITCQAGGAFSEVPNQGACVGINDCLYHSCGPFGKCVDEHMDYSCDCDAGYEQVVDEGSGEKLCGNIDDCGPSQCGIGTCEDLLQDYKCHCPTGYEEVEGPEEKTCERVVCGTPPAIANALTLPVMAANAKQVYEDISEFECQTGYSLNPDAIQGIRFHVECKADKSYAGPFTTTTTTTTTTTIGVPNLQGIQYDVPISKFAGWTTYYDAPYHDHTYLDEIFPPGGPCMLWGAKESAGASTFKIMAMGMRSTLIGLKQPPHNMWENGVYWYSVNSKSNGFAPNSHVQLNSADVGDLWDNCHRRLSWHLGQSVGGYRVGCAKWLNGPGSAGNWRKVVMYGPCGAGAFLQVSNASTSKKSSALEVSTKKRRVEDSCQPVNCGAVPTVAFCSPDKDTAVYGDSIKYTCEEGYTVDGTAAGQTHFSITCEADARLTSPGECQRIACGMPEAQANAVIYPVAMYYKDEISITCESGYTFTGKGDGDTTYKRECQKDGELTELKECKPIECGDIRDELSPLNGVVDSPGTAKYPSVSEVTCDEGYTIDGLPVPDPAMPMKIGIQLDIKVDEFTSKGWRTHYDKPYSHHTTVADLLPPEGDCILWGAKQSSGSGYFKLAGMGKRTRLLALKNWPYATTENGFYWYMKPTQSAGLAAHMSGVGLNSADILDNQCERRLSWHMGQNVGGYRAGCTKSLNGDGTWRKVVMYGPCTDLYAGNQEWHLAPPGAHECDAGSPAPEAHCQQIVKEFASDIGKTPARGLQIGAGGGCMDGGWGQVPLGCSAQSGGDWAGHFKKSGGLGAGCIHSAYQLVCSGPSSHQGESTFTATCQADGTFDKPAGCKPVVCGPAPTLEGASRPDGEITFAAEVEYTCDDGFTIGGHKGGDTKHTVGCHASGEFDMPPPSLVCVNVDDCAGHTCGPHGTCIDKINDYECDCKDGYEENEVDGEKVCGNIDDCGGHSCGAGNCIDLVGDYMCECPTGYSQEIVGEEKTCMPVRCADSPPSLSNGQKISGGDGVVRYPSTLEYKCNDDYTTDGSPSHNKKRFSVTCSINGALEPMLACQKIRCGNPPQPANAVLQSPSRYAVMTAGDKARYNCATGHKIGGSGNGASFFDVKCKRSGQFTPVQSCEPVVCGSPPGQNWANPNIVGSVKYGMNLIYTCHSGFTVNQAHGGPTTFRKICQANGHFSGATAFIQTSTELEGVDSEEDLKDMKNTSVQETKNLSFLQTAEKTEEADVEDADEDFDGWDEDGEGIEDDENDVSLLEEDSTRGKSQSGDKVSWGRRRRDRRRRTRRRRCTTPTSTTTGYYGCHPIFSPPPCIPDVQWNWDWLNPFKPGGWDWFAFMQNGKDFKAHLGTLKMIKFGKIQTKTRDEGQLIIGDAISFSCPPGQTITGDPNGAHGASGQVMESGEIMDFATGGAFPNGCLPVTYTIIGKVTNMINGMPIPGVKVTIGSLESTTSDAGIYDIEGVPSGPAEISFEKSGYTSTNGLSINVVANTEVGGVADALMINQPLEEDEWVLELRWDTEDDLDIEATWADKKVFFGQKIAQAAGITVKFLLDSPNGKKGKETLMVSNSGDCSSDPESYYCHLELKVRSDSDMSGSGAVAKLFHGAVIAGEFPIDACQEAVTEGGKWWHVFSLNSKSNSLMWTCNGVAGGASLLQEGKMKIPGKHSTDNLHPRKHAIDYTSYVGPFPGRFFRHSIKNSKNRTTAAGKKFLPVPSPSKTPKKTASLASVQSSSKVPKRQTITHGHKEVSKTDPNEADPRKTDPNWRIIHGKVVFEPRKPSPAHSSRSPTGESTEANQQTTHDLSTSKSSTADISSTNMYSGGSQSSSDTDVSLKVESSEVDVRPRGHPQPADKKKISPHF